LFTKTEAQLLRLNKHLSCGQNREKIEYQEIHHEIDMCVLTFQVLSPGRRTNSGSSLETSSSSTEFPLLRRSYKNYLI
jgi:hypothetical protein